MHFIVTDLYFEGYIMLYFLLKEVENESTKYIFLMYIYRVPTYIKSRKLSLLIKKLDFFTVRHVSG